MNTKELLLQVSSSAGTVSAEYRLPDAPVALLTLAHGAGAGMNHPFMTSLADELAACGIATLRFNFPFIEKKQRRVDFPAVAHKTVEAAISEGRRSFPDLPLFAAGKSFGGRMSSQYLSAHPVDFVQGIIFYGFPLHPPDKVSSERAEHLKPVSTPILFLQGTKDEMAEPNLFRQVCTSLQRSTLVEIEGADHGFKKGKQNVVPELALHTKEWVMRILGSSGQY